MILLSDNTSAARHTLWHCKHSSCRMTVRSEPVIHTHNAGAWQTGAGRGAEEVCAGGQGSWLALDR